MARVSSILQAGLSAASGPSAQLQEAPEGKVLARVKNAAARRTAVDTAGLPNDLVPSVAAGAGLGAVFGPVGALLGAGIAHTLSKKRREGIAAYGLAQEQNREDVFKQSRGALSRAHDLATTDGERNEITMMQDQLDGLYALSGSPDPQTSIGAIVKAQALSGTLDETYDDWEGERIDEQQRAEKRAADVFAVYDNLAGDLRTESSRYVGSREVFNKAIEHYNTGGAQADTALIYLTAQSIDPAAIVTDGDSKMIQATGTVSEQMAGYLNSLIDGSGKFDSNVRDGLMAVIANNYKVTRRDQMDTNGRYQRIGEAAGLSGTFLNELQVKIDPAERETLQKFSSYRPPGSGDVDAPVADLVDATGARQDPGVLAKHLSRVVKGIEELGADVSRQLQDKELLVTDDGRRFEKDSKTGNIAEIPRENWFVVPETGEELRLIDHGDGRTEWKSVKPGKPSTQQRYDQLRRDNPRRPTN